MRIAYIASSEFGCPAPSNQIQAALWVASEIIEEMTRRGHHTMYVGAGDSTVGASEIRSMGSAFFDVYDYNEWIQLTVAEKDQTLNNYQIKLQLFLQEVLKDTPVDIVHFHTSPPIFMLPFSKNISVPKIQTFHDPLLASYEQIFYAYKDISSNHFVSISNSQRNGAPYLSYDATVYNGIPIDAYPFHLSASGGFVFLGRIKKIKGVKDAVVAATRAGVALTVAGRAAHTEEEFMKTEVLPYIDGTKIRQIGVVGHDEKVQLFGSAKGLLFPIGWEEPFGLVMVEAMACGTPVIAYNRGSVPEVIKDGVTGFIVDQDDTVRPGKGSWIIKKQGVEGLVEAMSRIGELDRVAARKHVEANFTVKKMCDKYEKLYTSICQK